MNAHATSPALEHPVRVRAGSLLLEGTLSIPSDAPGVVVFAHGLPRVQEPTLLIVGGNDLPVIQLNRQALDRLGSREKHLHIVPGATHLFEEPGTLEEVARLAAGWFARHLAQAEG